MKYETLTEKDIVRGQIYARILDGIAIFYVGLGKCGDVGFFVSCCMFS